MALIVQSKQKIIKKRKEPNDDLKDALTNALLSEEQRTPQNSVDEKDFGHFVLFQFGRIFEKLQSIQSFERCNKPSYLEFFLAKRSPGFTNLTSWIRLGLDGPLELKNESG